MKRAVPCLVAALLLPLATMARDDVKLSVETQYLFDNHEFDPSSGKIIPSGTEHFIRVTPRLCWLLSDGPEWSHSINVGVDLVKDAGTGQASANPVGEVPLYFASRRSLDEGEFEAFYGIYPRRTLDGHYSELITSEEIFQRDFNMDGMILKYHTGSFAGELALDWMGKYGHERKERFQILGSALWQSFGGVLSSGVSGSFYHLAGSELAPGVVDNHVVEPFVLFDFATLSALDVLSLRLAGFYSYQKDRVRDDLRHLKGCETELTLGWKSLTLKNNASYTDNFLPFYDMTDTAGNRYGDLLYRGSKFYNGFYDRIEFAWTPHVFGRLRLRLCLRLHYNISGFLGSEQRLAIICDL